MYNLYITSTNSFSYSDVFYYLKTLVRCCVSYGICYCIFACKEWSRVSVIGMYASVALLCELRGLPKSAGIGSVNGLPWLSEMTMVAVKLNEYNMLPSSSTPSLNPYPIGSTYSTIERTSGLKMLDGRSSYTPYP